MKRFWAGNLKDKEYWENQVILGRKPLKSVLLNDGDGRILSGFTWFRKGTSGGLLLTR
jgi:hypothetical protein